MKNEDVEEDGGGGVRNDGRCTQNKEVVGSEVCGYEQEEEEERSFSQLEHPSAAVRNTL